MATISMLNNLDSDSEGDSDFAPNDAEDGLSDPSGDERGAESARTESPKLSEQDRDKQRKARAALWADFQTSVSSPQPSDSQVAPKKMVKIKKRFRFAGEDVVEVTEVPEDSADAKKWPLWDPSDESGPSVATSVATDVVSESQPGTPSTTPSEPAPKPLKRRPGPRKPKTTLAALPSTSSQKAKKLSTLEKSAMDWRAHVSAEADNGMKDELEANRRGGGYLEKVEFLDRVGQRRDDLLDAQRSAKRRRA